MLENLVWWAATATPVQLGLVIGVGLVVIGLLCKLRVRKRKYSAKRRRSVVH